MLLQFITAVVVTTAHSVVSRASALVYAWCLDMVIRKTIQCGVVTQLPRGLQCTSHSILQCTAEFTKVHQLYLQLSQGYNTYHNPNYSVPPLQLCRCGLPKKRKWYFHSGDY